MFREANQKKSDVAAWVGGRRMEKIVFTAQAFGFGPISKMLAVSENISEVKKVFFGSVVALDMAKLHQFDEIYELTYNDSSKILELLRESKLFINVMDFPLSKLAKDSGCPCFLIDSLLWFWPTLPEGVRDAEIYFCQNFFTSVEQKIQEYRLSNACLIGPIISNHFGRYEKKNQVVINFGGIENPHVEIGVNSNYPFIMLKILLPMLQDKFDLVLVTGRERVMEMCRQRFTENERLKFRMFGQKEMLEELYRSEALFTAPGIQTFYDAHDKLPIFCLLPQNNSNVRNLDAMVKSKAIQHYLKWEELYEFDFDGCKTPEEEFDLMLGKLEIFEKSESDQRIMGERVEKFLNSRNLWPNLVEEQRNAVEKLGSNGIKTIVDDVNAVLFGR